MITSKHNALVKLAREIRDGKHKDRLFLEGVRLAEEAVATGEADAILNAIHTEEFGGEARNAALLDALRETHVPLTVVSKSVLNSISDLKAPAGVIVLARRPATGIAIIEAAITPSALLVILHRINNPSNAGAILRTAEAAGATGAILTDGTADAFSPKALRGAMGSSLRLPLWTNATVDQAVHFCRTRKIRVFATDLDAAQIHTEADWTGPCAVLVGAEAPGLASREIESADESIRIPMLGAAESLNVAVATGVILYEAARQRAGRKEKGKS